MVLDPDPKGYTIVPTTIHPGEEAPFVLSVFTKASISLEAVRRWLFIWFSVHPPEGISADFLNCLYCRREFSSAILFLIGLFGLTLTSISNSYPIKVRGY
ncbi:hypothetical protein ACB092_08G191900 [Castanea dentata]